MDCSIPGFSVLHCLPEFSQTSVWWVDDAMQPSQSLWLLFSFCPQYFPIRDFSSELVLGIRWPKYWSFWFSIRPSNEYSGFISFRIDCFDLLAAQWTHNSLRYHYSSKATVLWCSAFFVVQLSRPYMSTRIAIALTPWTFVSKVMSMPSSKMLCRFVIAFLPRSTCHLISRLQSPSSVSLEPKKIKSVTVSVLSLSIWPKWWTLDATNLMFSMVSFKPVFFTALFQLHQEAL